MIVNLLSNAYKYTMEGEIILSASILIEEERRMLQVKVIDTGIGIREEDQQNLFKLFSRLREGT